MGWWRNLWTQQANDWIYAELRSDRLTYQGNPTPIQANSEYISIFLRSMRIVNVRKGLDRFYGTVHSFISLPHRAQGKAEFHALTTPTDLKDIDAKNVDRMISLNHRLLGPTPYRGGDLEVEIGLFSIKSSELAAPFLSLLENLASTAGVSYVNAAMPFVKALLEGVNLLTGTQGDSILEIGLKKTFTPPKTGHILLMRAQKGSVNVSRLSVDSDFRLLDEGGQPFSRYPYMIIGVESSHRREDWFSIPELRSAHHYLIEQIQQGNGNDQIDALSSFKKIVLTSPDLVSQDGQRIFQEVEKDILLVTSYRPTSMIASIPQIRTLDEIDIYSDLNE